MPVISLKTDDNKIRRYKLKQGKSLQIGRIDDNDIIIENPSVSGHHATIESDGEAFFLADNQSSNGSFVNNQLVIYRRLDHKDIITIGNQPMIFAYLDEETPPVASDEDEGLKTIAIDTSKHRSLLAKGVSNIVSQKSEKKLVGILTSVEDSKDEFELNNKITKIGKSPTSDIVVRGFLVGKTAAIIVKKEQGYYLSHVKGRAKPKIYSQTVTSEVLLKEYDLIEIGSAKLQFIFKMR
ncbi:FHA domain-containing protein [Desulfococcaceae bacterium HSG9]|nr:FHA domain-containing protein [Desulfococcaceae bacterium HSG9]